MTACIHSPTPSAFHAHCFYLLKAKPCYTIVHCTFMQGMNTVQAPATTTAADIHAYPCSRSYVFVCCATPAAFHAHCMLSMPTAWCRALHLSLSCFTLIVALQVRVYEVLSYGHVGHFDVLVPSVYVHARRASVPYIHTG